MKKIIDDCLQSHINTINFIRNNLLDVIQEATKVIINSIKNGGTIFFTGNGGSAADCQHLAAEFVGRFLCERCALPAIALTTDTSILTAIGNDYGYESIFTRQIEALVTSRDVVVFISTSGNSQNQLEGVKKAKEIKAGTIGLLGKDGGKLGRLVDINILIPGTDSPHIQEAHITIGHIICKLVEQEFK